MTNDTRKLIPVKKHPGIYKIFERNPESSKLEDSGRYKVSRRILKNGQSKKEWAIFSNFSDAKDFRAGKIDKVADGVIAENKSFSKDQLCFGELVEEWKSFHSLKIQVSTAQLYEHKLLYLDTLMADLVEEIDVRRIDRLVAHWRTSSHSSRRQCFDKELQLLTVILNYYRERKNLGYMMPVRDEHFEAAQVVQKSKEDVRALEEQDLPRFLQGLRESKNPLYYPLALTQFSLALRVSEVCGLRWEDVDLERGLVQIRQVVWWDRFTQKAAVKGITKNGKARVLSMPQVLVDVLHELKRNEVESRSGKLIFQSKKGGPLVRKSIAAVYNRTLRKLGIDYVSGTHMLRKSAATLANDVMGDFHAVSSVLDHSSVAITERYVRRLPSQKRKFAEAINDVLTSADRSNDEGSNLDVTSSKKAQNGDAGSQWFPNPKKPVLRLIKCGG